MKHYDKIKKIRRQQHLTVRDVYERGVAILGKRKAISISTINRIEAGKSHKFASLVKLCFILGVELKDLYKGTELEECLVIRRKERTSEYIISDKAVSHIINSPNQNYLAQEYVLLPTGQVPLDHAAEDRQRHEKLIYVISGELTCVVAGDRYVLTTGDTLSFNSIKPHYCENRGPAKCKFLSVENPGRY
jgi:transcriptional regulator with XRE-family HTH domain